VKEGQKIKSEVQLATEDFVLVLLKGHAAGQFAYLPAKRVRVLFSADVDFLYVALLRTAFVFLSYLIAVVLQIS